MTHDAQLSQLRRIRLFVRGGFTLGIAVSLTANVLHAEPNLVSQGVAAWAPLALLLAVELIARTPATRPGRSRVRITAVAIIASIAAWVSYWHMVDVATRYGETGINPYLLPISVDGLIVVASISLVEIGDRLRELEHTTNGHTAGRIVTEPAPINPDAPTPAPASARVDTSRPAIAIPADTAARLAATFNPTAPTATAPATHNGHQAADTTMEQLA